MPLELFPHELPARDAPRELEIVAEISHPNFGDIWVGAQKRADFQFNLVVWGQKDAPEIHYFLGEAPLGVYQQKQARVPANFSVYGEEVKRPAKLEKFVRARINAKAWGRIFYLPTDNGDGQLLLFLAASGWGAWHLNYSRFSTPRFEPMNQTAIFKWKSPAATLADLALSSPILWESLQNASEDIENDIGFARRWVQTAVFERDSLIVSYRNGSRRKWEEVMRWVALSHPELGEEFFWSLSPPIFGFQDEIEGKLGHLCNTTLSPQIRDLATQIWLHFAPNVRETFRFPCAQHSNFQSHCWIQIDKPTAHERLEAACKLEEWLQERGLKCQ